MKKTLTFIAIAAFVVCSNATTIIWGTGTGAARATFDGAYVGGTAVMGYLVLLDSDLTSAERANWFDNFVAADIVDSASAGTTGVAKGRIDETYITDWSNLGSTGAWFGMYMTYTDADGTIWTNVATAMNISSIDNADAINNYFTFNYATPKDGDDYKTGTSLSVGGGWSGVAVPEPATAGLAIAGLALLFKRRRK